ncbi:hypothetical protein Aeqsu_2460 [Aequorivita sublithincola DSM 14238]|uniref:DUF4249 family protein n=1 Tax=Aequorivita sublithincola (strain DSM 14238 / LMG 21431 / ACAM 643 / 9-3) TaxID=746697 RepID=I3YY50_AEQSU|nr:hypothetical protein [Aequorivita sublithincola]AFL81918.1 hypothetical protein Aeqsu_2460 [Aequorivita sublithincola DSM 14238]
MKKIFLLLVLSAVMFSCSKDADDTDSGLQDFTVTINVDPDYHFSKFTKSLTAFLSDQNGTIVASGELQTGQTVTLKFAGAPSAIYDLSYMKYDFLDFVGEDYFSLTTFSAIEQGNYTICARPIIENSNDEIYINIENTGYPCLVTSSTSSSGTYGPENGGYYNFRSNLQDSPKSDFYVSFKSPNDQFDRYFWQRDIPEGTTFNLDYNTLPEVKNIVSVQSPSNTIFNYALEGLPTGQTKNTFQPIREGNYPGGIASLSIPVPTNIFDSYLFRISFGNDNFQYFKDIHSATIPTFTQEPNLSFMVNNESASTFNMTINGDAAMYNVIFRGSDATETVFMSHAIYGEVASEVTFSKENLRINIQQSYPKLSNFETLLLGTVSLTNYSTLSSYKDILKYRIQGKAYEIPINGLYEGVSKQFD